MIAAVMLSGGAVLCCGIAVVLMIIGIIAGIAANQKERYQAREIAAGRVRPLPSNTAFQTFVSTEMKDFDKISLEVFTVEMQGPVNAPMDNCPVLKTITLFDITGGEKDQKPVLCSLDNFQYQGTMAFYSATADVLPYRMSIISDWQPLLSIPVETLTFPARGIRKLLFTVVLSTVNNQVLAQSTNKVDYTNNSPGYLDSMKARLKAGELAVKLAVSVSAADGSFAGTESRVVKEWIEKRVASSVDSQKEEVRRKLNRAVEDSMMASGRASLDDLVHLCDDLIQLNPLPAASMGDKYDILELCLKVASADGTAKGVELDLVNALAESLGVDRERFRTMTEKILPVAIHETEDADRILGIDPGWSIEQKRKHLRKENRKWRALATHSDPEKQKQARQMQELIAMEMAKLESADEEG